MSNFVCKLSGKVARLRLRRVTPGLGAALLVAATTCVVVGATPSAGAADPVDLGDASSFAVLAGTSVVNQNSSGNTTVIGNLGVSPGGSVVGFPPGVVQGGAIHAADSLATSARADIIAVYNELSAIGPVTTVPAELGGTTKGPGVFSAAGGAFTMNGTLTVDAERDPDSIFVFKATSLATAQSSNITLINGAQIKNLYFLITGSATLGQWTSFRGNLLAQDTVTVSPGASIYGRLFGIANYVIMSGSPTGLGTVISLPDNPPTTTTLAASPNPSSQGQAVTFTATVSAVSGSVIPQGEIVFKDGATIIGSDMADQNGIATFTTSAPTPGNHQMTAVYLGGDTFNNEAVITFAPSTSSDVVQVVTASLFNASATPAIDSNPDAQAVTVGVKFTVGASGTVSGIRYFKGTQNTGTHTGSLWTSNGQLIANAVFSNETAFGWQQVYFITPVTVTPNTTYVASYHTTSGHYSITRSQFTSAYTNGSLTALADGASGGNGVYTYGASNTFPTSSFQATNYWVDVLFIPFSSLWNPTDVPAVTSHADPNAVTLGVKFQATRGGTITGIRFHKGTGNTGAHTGSLWTDSGQLLASAVFTNETASGWQQVNFTTPVPIDANTIYVAGYHTPSGMYSINRPYFGQRYTNGSLIAPANNTASGNGVYAYSALSTFPTSSYQSTNYWVDVVFRLA